jgi:UDP:flavonoid glycosyltransferase YjiC (YdhE family)
LQEAGLPALVYGTSLTGTDGNVTYRRPCNTSFLEDLARCRAVLSTAGNQLVGEALHFGKPMLVHPERCVEQRLNAAAVSRLGIGQKTRHEDISADVIQRFLREAPHYEAGSRGLVQDGRADALAAIESFASELAQAHRSKRSRSWELAW